MGGFAGDVVDRRIFQFTMMEIGNWIDADQSTGRLIHMPNAILFTQPLANYVSGFPYLWNELRVTVTFESDWRRAKSILSSVAGDLTADITQEATETRRRDEERFLIHYRSLTPVVYTSVVDSGVLLTLRYLCRPRERRGMEGELWERILEAFVFRRRHGAKARIDAGRTAQHDTPHGVLTRAISQQACEIVEASDGLEALELLRAGEFNLVFTDLDNIL